MWIVFVRTWGKLHDKKQGTKTRKKLFTHVLSSCSPAISPPQSFHSGPLYFQHYRSGLPGKGGGGTQSDGVGSDLALKGLAGGCDAHWIPNSFLDLTCLHRSKGDPDQCRFELIHCSWWVVLQGKQNKPRDLQKPKSPMNAVWSMPVHQIRLFRLLHIKIHFCVPLPVLTSCSSICETPTLGDFIKGCHSF